MLIVEFKGQTYSVVFQRYPVGGRLGMRLVTDDPQDQLVATVNIPEASLAPGEVLIKDWSENEGVLAALVAVGVVTDTGRTVPSRYVRANVCRLTPAAAHAAQGT